jgi:hypothetical protein
MVDAGMARAEQRDAARLEAWQAMGWAAEPRVATPHDDARITTKPNSQILAPDESTPPTFDCGHYGVMRFPALPEDYR